VNAGPLADRTVVVTGGTKGIGAAVVRLAKEQGARVAVLDLVSAPDCYIECDVASALSRCVPLSAKYGSRAVLSACW
jgi:NAD(P)-dependent dehydrogenase (short-subunit alcohol dehydrogenase family)